MMMMMMKRRILHGNTVHYSLVECGRRRMSPSMDRGSYRKRAREMVSEVVISDMKDRFDGDYMI